MAFKTRAVPSLEREERQNRDEESGMLVDLVVEGTNWFSSEVVIESTGNEGAGREIWRFKKRGECVK